MVDLLSESLLPTLLKLRKRKDLQSAKRVQKHILNCGLEDHRVIGNHLVQVLVECGDLQDAQRVLYNLSHPSEFSWTSLIVGYAQNGQLQHALSLYKEMQDNFVEPSSFTLLPLLKACAVLENPMHGREIHSKIVHKGLDRDLVVSSCLLDMYAKCGCLGDAEDVFSKVAARDVVLWTAFMTGYVEHGNYHGALKCYERMQTDGIFPNEVSFVCVLKACGSVGSIDKGRQIHSDIIRSGFERDLFVGSTLVDVYCKFVLVFEAQVIFDILPLRDVVLWNALITGYVEYGSSSQALNCFEAMNLESVLPDAGTHSCILKACGNIRDLDKGQKIHTRITCLGLESDSSVTNTLLVMYARCGSLIEAQKICSKLPVQDIETWNAMIAAYTEQGAGFKAVECYEQILSQNMRPNAVTFVYALKACDSIGAIDKGHSIHVDIRQRGLESDLSVGSILVCMYAKHSLLPEAEKVFKKMPTQDSVSWNALIVGYTANGLSLKTVKCYECMQAEGISPTDVTLIAVLKACGNMGTLEKCQEIHIQIVNKGLEKELIIGNTLLDMYGKFGLVFESRDVFDRLPFRDVISWTALVGTYATNHMDDLAICCFDEMRKQGLAPNSVTFTNLLTACSHESLLDKSQDYFRMMSEDYGITPTSEHYTCIVDLLARSGHLHEAERFLGTIPRSLAEETWKALLSRCGTHLETKVGQRCFKELIQMNPREAASYVLLANTLASSGKWDDAYKIEELRNHALAQKKPAAALIELNEKMYEFVVGHNQSKGVAGVVTCLSLRTRDTGHVPDLDLILRPEDQSV